jgi:hypothetical protein
LKEEEGKDFSAEVLEVEAEILKLWDSLQQEQRLRHVKEAGVLFNQLEQAYVKQASFRSDQMTRMESIRVKIRILHEPFTARWIKDLTGDVQDLMTKRHVHGEEAGSFDRETGEHQILVTHNLKSVNIALKKILSAMTGVRESSEGLGSIDGIEKIYLTGHEAAGVRLKEEQILTSRTSYEELFGIVKTETPKFTEMTLVEAVIEGAVNRTVGALEYMKKGIEV